MPEIFCVFRNIRQRIRIEHHEIRGLAFLDGSISTSGGEKPIWSRDGKEIYFISADQKMMAATVTRGPSPSDGST